MFILKYFSFVHIKMKHQYYLINIYLYELITFFNKCHFNQVNEIILESQFYGKICINDV